MARSCSRGLLSRLYLHHSCCWGGWGCFLDPWRSMAGTEGGSYSPRGVRFNCNNCIKCHQFAICTMLLMIHTRFVHCGCWCISSGNVWHPDIINCYDDTLHLTIEETNWVFNVTIYIKPKSACEKILSNFIVGNITTLLHTPCRQWLGVTEIELKNSSSCRGFRIRKFWEHIKCLIS